MFNKFIKGLREYWYIVFLVEEVELVFFCLVLVIVCNIDFKVKGCVFCEGVEVDEEF